MLVAGVLEGLIEHLMLAGVSRMGSLAVHKATRLKKISDTIKGLPQAHESVRTAIRDFEHFLATGEDGLNQKTYRFLRELQSTGIITAIAEEAVIGKRSQGTKIGFLKLYVAVCGGEAEPCGAELYGKICAAFEASMGALIQDPALGFLVRTAEKSLADQISTLAERLSSSRWEDGPFADFDLLQGFLQRLARALVSSYRTIRVETNKGAKNIDLDKIYVPSKLRNRRESQVVADITLGTDAFLKRGAADRAGRSKLDETSISYPDFQEEFRRVVVLGDPGGGKSTLCQHVCYRLTKNFNLCAQFPDSFATRGNLQSARIALRIVLRNFEAARVKDPQLGIFDFLARDVKGTITSTEEEARYALEYCLSLGRCVLAFDGLDEILNTSVRRDFVTLVTSFCEEYPLCPVLVTSRLVGYEDAPLADYFDELMLDKFDVDEIRYFVVRFLRVIASLGKEEASLQAAKFIEQTESTAEDLRENPLMLGLMAFIFMNKGDVPTNRPEIYQECAMLMFEKWDQRRNIRADIPEGFDLLHLFSEIASEIFGNPELEDGVGWGWLESINRRYFATLFETAAKANEAAKKVSRFLTGRSWVLSEFGADVYRFTHRTFLEYFFARHVDEHNETVGDLFALLAPKIVNKQWDVISHLSLQIKTYRSQRRTSQALRTMSELIEGASYGLPERLIIAGFSARALQYLLGPEGETRALLEAIYRAAIDGVTGGEIVTPASVIAESVSCITGRREYAALVVGQVIDGTIRNGTAASTDFACGLISPDEYPHHLLPPKISTKLPEGFRAALRRKLRELIRQRADADPFYAMLYWEWYQSEFSSLFERHGLPMLFAERRPQALVPMLPDPGLNLVRITRAHAGPLRRGQSEDALWKEPLRAVGRYSTLNTPLPTLGAKTSVSMNLYTTSGFWVGMIRALQGDADALRGIVICLVMHVHALKRRERKRQTRWPMVSRNRGQSWQEQHLVVAAVDKAISGLPDDQRARFDFWQKDKLGQLRVFERDE